MYLNNRTTTNPIQFNFFLIFKGAVLSRKGPYNSDECLLTKTKLTFYLSENSPLAGENGLNHHSFRHPFHNVGRSLETAPDKSIKSLTMRKLSTIFTSILHVKVIYTFNLI